MKHASGYLKDPRVRGLEKRGASYRLVIRSGQREEFTLSAVNDDHAVYLALGVLLERDGIDTGTPVKRSSGRSLTLLAYLPRFAERAAMGARDGKKGLRSRSESSIANYVSKARKWSGELGEKPMSELGERDFEQWLHWLDGRPLSENTKRAVRVAVSAVLTTAVGDSDSGLEHNPAREHLDIGEAKTRSTFPTLSEAEVTTIVTLLPDRELQVLSELQYALGLRPAEARGLTWESLSLDTNEYQLAGQVQGRRLVHELKTRRSGTRTKMAPEAVTLLRRWMMESGRRDGLVFRRDDEPVSEPVYRLAFKAAAKQVGRDVTPHALRHSAAMRLRKGGISTSDLARFMRDEVETVEKFYGGNDGIEQRLDRALERAAEA